MSNVEIIDPVKYGIEETKAHELIGNLPQIQNERTELEKQFNEVIRLDIEQPETTVKARELRLLIQKNRTKGIGVWHKTTKDYFLKGGQFVDAIKRREVAINERMENDLEQIEKHFENLEKKRLELLQKARVNMLSKYVEDAGERDLSYMDCDVWEAYFQTKKKAYEERIEAEKKVEEQRIEKENCEILHNSRKNSILHLWEFMPEENRAENFGEWNPDMWGELVNYLKLTKSDFDKEQEEIRLENERLKKEAEAEKKRQEAEQAERERLAKIEADKAAKIEARNRTRNEQLRSYIKFIRDYNGLLNSEEKDYQKAFSDIKRGAEEHWEYERKEQIRQADEEEARQEALRAEREKAEKLENELRLKKEQEEKALKEAEEKKQAELSKGDSAKVEDLISDLEALKKKYVFRSAKNKKMYNTVGLLIDKIINHIEIN